MKWIKDPKVIELIVALGAVQVGDEVRLRACDATCAKEPNHCSHTKHYGMYSKRLFADRTVCFVKALRCKAAYPQTGVGDILVYSPAGWLGTYIDVHNIIAWRRPNKEKA